MDIADKIMEQIAHHRAEILRLESALDVLIELGGKGVAGKGGKQQQPMITIRKMEHQPPARIEKAPAPAPAKKKQPLPIKSRARGIEDKKRTREGIIEALSHGPLSTKELIDRFGPKNPDQADKQVIYALMYELRQAGIVERQNQGTTRIFSLAHPPQAMAAAG